MATGQKEPDFEDISEFAANMAKFAETSQEIARLYMETHGAEDVSLRPDPLNIAPTMNNFAGSIMSHPGEVMDAAMKYWNGQVAVWTDAANKVLGTDAGDRSGSVPNLPEGGRRFAHPLWSENAMLEYVKRSYLLANEWAQDLVEAADEGLEPRDRRKIEYIMRNVMDAANPANFAGINPEVMEATVSEKGANLVRGAQMMLEDMRRGKGDLLIRQTDMDAFEVGRNMAVTEGKVVFQNEIIQLIQYAPKTEKVHETPLLFFPPWINKYYVLDLNERKSMMKWLVEQGHTVFMVSWVNPDENQAGETWETYIEKGALTAIDKVLEETGAKQVNLGSYCIGGTLTGTLLAKLSRAKDKRIKSTTFFTAQLDFQDAGELQAFVDEETLKLVEEQSSKGFLPARAMATAFNTLRSNDLVWSYVVGNYMLGKEPFPFDLLYWNSDSTCMPGRVHKFYLEQFYVRNAFAEGKLEVDGEILSIGDITGDVYHVATVEDHIAPAASVYRGARQMVKANVTFVLSGSGHIAGVVNPPAGGKYQYWTDGDQSQEALDDWKSGAQMTEGSWWPHWDAWLAGHSKKLVAARRPGKKLKPIEDAPGSYVRKRFDAE